MRISARFRNVADRLKRFNDKAGFALLVTLCVGVIASTAVWTRSNDAAYAAPTPPASEANYAALQMQQSLSAALSSTPLPTRSQMQWAPPLKEAKVLQGYSKDALVKSGVTGIWSVHPGVDLKGELGEIVTSVADGTVTDLGDGDMEGTWVVISHADGSNAKYAGLSMLSAIQKGDRVRRGQTIGFMGNTYVSEGDLGPHLHLEIWNDGQPLDPMSIIQ